MRPRSPGAELSLAWLLDPLPVETFLDGVWARDHHHVARDRPDYFEPLLAGPSVVDRLLEAIRHEPSVLRMTRGADKIGPDSYRLADGSLDLAAVRADFADGYTIVVDGAEQYLRTVRQLARTVEVELNFATQVNVYVTPPHSSGLLPHYDDHDVVILQIDGSKRWQLYVGADRAPRQIQRDGEKAVDPESLPPPIELDVRAGDALYVPRGRVHAAATGGDSSVHLTVGIHAPTVLMLAVGALYSRSFHDDRLNARLPVRHLDDPAAGEAVRALMREAVDAVDNPDAVTDSLGLLADVLVRRGSCPPVGPIADAKSIDGHTRVAKCAPLYSRVAETADGVTLQFASLSINATVDHAAAMRFVSAGTVPFRVADLPGLTTKQQADLARSLIISGFLIRLPEQEADGRDG